MDFSKLATEESVNKTIAGLKLRNIDGELVPNKEAALARIRELIPPEAEVYTGGSTTLEQIGFIDVLKSGDHPWNNLKAAVLAEKDPEKQNELRAKTVASEYFLGSVHAVTEGGQFLVASNTGSQIPSYAYTSKNVIWVVGAQKIVPDFETAMKRVHEYCLPLEDKRMKGIGQAGSAINKLLIFNKEKNPERKLRMIFVNEVLGF